MADSAEQQQIRTALAGLTAAWRTGRTADIGAMLHPSVVFVHPGFTGRAEGREACVATYDQFLKAAIVLRYEESPAVIDAYGDTGVVTLQWEMSWEMGGQRSEESGHDLYVFTREGGRWLIVWRTLVGATGS
jgi:ketosteroid isomerase-like protein